MTKMKTVPEIIVVFNKPSSRHYRIFCPDGGMKQVISRSRAEPVNQEIAVREKQIMRIVLNRNCCAVARLEFAEISDTVNFLEH
jgi:hypothetical protein